MNKYIIERTIAGAGELNRDELQGISQSSCAILNELGPDIKWLESYVTADKIYCVYLAASEEIIREHASKGGFPAGSIALVGTVISPETARG